MDAVIDTYKLDAVISWQRDARIKKGPDYRLGVKRSRVQAFTAKSKMRLNFAIRNVAVEYQWLITLTYPGAYPLEGRVVKKHLNTLLQWLRRLDAIYFWVIEFQIRGAPHFHIFTTKEIDKNMLSERWYKIVRSGDVKHLRAGTRVEKLRDAASALRYSRKYIEKNYQKDVPESYKNVGRFWGHGRKAVQKTSRRFKTYYMFPGFQEAQRRFFIRSLRKWVKAKYREWGKKTPRWISGLHERNKSMRIIWEGARFVRAWEGYFPPPQGGGGK